MKYSIFAMLLWISSFTYKQEIPYRVIKIAGKIWMAENYRGNISAGGCYENNLANCMNFGRLFTYTEAVNSAPKGWHLPSKEEWNSLLNQIKAEGKNPYMVLTEGEFDARLAGYKDSYGDFTKINYQGRFWSSDSWGNEDDKAWYVYLSKSRQIADMDTDEKKCMFSVRYVKD